MAARGDFNRIMNPLNTNYGGIYSESLNPSYSNSYGGENTWNSQKSWGWQPQQQQPNYVPNEPTAPVNYYFIYSDEKNPMFDTGMWFFIIVVICFIFVLKSIEKENYNYYLKFSNPEQKKGISIPDGQGNLNNF